MRQFILLSPALLLAGCIVIRQPESTQAWTPAPVVAQPAPELGPAMGQPAPMPQPIAAPPPAPIVVEQPQPPAPPPPVVVEMPPPLEPPQIEFVYREVLDRAPTDREVWEWSERSRRQRVSPEDVRHALRDSSEFRDVVPERVVRSAFWEYHHAQPDAELMRLYRRRMIDEGWSIDKVRRDIADRNMEAVVDAGRDGRWQQNPRGDNDHGDRNDRGDHDDRADRGDRDARGGRDDRGGRDGGRGGSSIDAIIVRAYDDLLERKPDAAGLDRYRQMLRQGASEADIRARIRESVEYRVTVPDAKTRRAYQKILGRAPDEGGLQHYRKLIVDKGWTEPDVENDLKKSAEYRDRKP